MHPAFQTSKLSSALTLLAELAGKELSASVRGYYIQELQTVPFERLEVAFTSAARECRWPTVKQILDAAGVSLTPVEKTIRQDATALDPETAESPKTGSPIIVWEMFAHKCGEDEREADMAFAAYSHQLETKGWNVFRVEKYRIKTDANTEINGILYKDSVWLWKALFSTIK